MPQTWFFLVSLAEAIVLLKTEVFPAQITKAVPILGENHHFFDPWELFKRSVNFGCNTCICSDPWRVSATAEFHRRGACFRNRAFLVQRECEVWTSNRQGCRAVRWAAENGIKFREVASLLFGESRSGD